MGESFLDKLRATERPAEPVAFDPASMAGRDATKYAMAALKGEVDNLLAVPIGEGRNHQLNISAMKLGQLVAIGVIEADLVTETLGAADGGLDFRATRKTIASGLAAGMAQGRNIPEPTHATREDVPPWEVSDDPLSEHYQPSQTEPIGSDTSSTTSTTASSPTANISSGITQPPNGSNGTDAEARHKANVAIEAAGIRLKRDAKRLVDQEDAAKLFRQPPPPTTLNNELAVPDEPVAYRIAQLAPVGSNVLLAAQYKTGKTTLVNDLARCLVDGDRFLGTYAVEPFEGRVAIFNYEVGRDQYRRWFRDVGVTNAERIAMFALRGYRVPILVPHIEDWVVEQLKAVEASVWIVDPYARAASGSLTNENDNTEAGAFLETLDVIKERAGIQELVLVTHTGRGEQEAGEEHGRGATRLDDWPDVRWLYMAGKGDTRFFRAHGRDVDTDETAVAYDKATRRLTLSGGDRYTVEMEALKGAVLTIVTNKPGVGVVDLRTGVKQILRKIDNNRVDSARDDLIATRTIHARRTGHTLGHFTGPDMSGGEHDPLS